MLSTTIALFVSTMAWKWKDCFRNRNQNLETEEDQKVHWFVREVSENNKETQVLHLGKVLL